MDRHSFLLNRLLDIYQCLSDRCVEPITRVIFSVRFESGREVANTIEVDPDKPEIVLGQLAQKLARGKSQVTSLTLRTCRDDCNGYNSFEIGFENPV